jgi:hypothetical protein
MKTFCDFSVLLNCSFGVFAPSVPTFCDLQAAA